MPTALDAKIVKDHIQYVTQRFYGFVLVPFVCVWYTFLYVSYILCTIHMIDVYASAGDTKCF